MDTQEVIFQQSKDTKEALQRINEKIDSISNEIHQINVADKVAAILTTWPHSRPMSNKGDMI